MTFERAFRTSTKSVIHELTALYLSFPGEFRYFLSIFERQKPNYLSLFVSDLQPF